MTDDAAHPDLGSSETIPGSLEHRRISHPDLPFGDLKAPRPSEVAPAASTRWLAFLGVLFGGLLGALVGYGIADVLYPDSIGQGIGAVVGGLMGAVGLGVLANLTIRAMGEWNTASHPEAVPDGDGRRARAKRARLLERQWTRRPSA